MKNKNLIGIILLAAGSAERMKKNKLLLKIGEESLLENALSSARNSKADFVTVVLGAFAENNLKVVEKYPFEIIVNETWEKGIGSSIKTGIQKTLEIMPHLDAVIISVCDQQFLAKEIFNGLIDTYKRTSKKIVASEYSDSIGVPVLYDKSLFTELLSIPDQHGAKKYVIEKAAEEIIATFPFPKGEMDVDTLEDLKNLYPRNKSRRN